MADTENHSIEFRKSCDYGNADNFQHPDEIMVTITLKEYRELVSSKATKESDMNRIRNDYYEKEKEYKARIEKLERKLLDDDDDDDDKGDEED